MEASNLFGTFEITAFQTKPDEELTKIVSERIETFYSSFEEKLNKPELFEAIVSKNEDFKKSVIDMCKDLIFAEVSANLKDKYNFLQSVKDSEEFKTLFNNNIYNLNINTLKTEILKNLISDPSKKEQFETKFTEQIKVYLVSKYISDIKSYNPAKADYVKIVQNKNEAKDIYITQPKKKVPETPETPRTPRTLPKLSDDESTYKPVTDLGKVFKHFYPSKEIFINTNFADLNNSLLPVGWSTFENFYFTAKLYGDPFAINFKTEDLTVKFFNKDSPNHKLVKTNYRIKMNLEAFKLYKIYSKIRQTKNKNEYHELKNEFINRFIELVNKELEEEQREKLDKKVYGDFVKFLDLKHKDFDPYPGH